MKLTYKNQIWTGVVTILVCFTLATILQQRLLNNLGWILYGLLWVIHPEFPANVTPKKHWHWYVRLAGAWIILLGLTAYFGV